MSDQFEVPEVHRTLAGFYPDAESRSQAHYMFAHRFLPQYVHQNAMPFHQVWEEPEAAITRFVQARFAMLEHMSGLGELSARTEVGFRFVDDLTANAITVGPHRAVLITMPPGDAMPQAIFVGIVLMGNEDDPGARLFTLEISFDHDPDRGVPASSGIFCEWTNDGDHHNHGEVVDATPEAFIEAMVDAL